MLTVRRDVAVTRLIVLAKVLSAGPLRLDLHDVKPVELG